MANYLFLSSAYRDRLLYPNPAEFVVPFGSINNVNQNTFNVFTTTNPITQNFPSYNSCWTNFFSPNPFVFETSIVSGSGIRLILDENVNTELLGIEKKPSSGENIYFSSDLENCKNILRGFYIVITTEDTSYFRIIYNYDPNTRQVVLRQQFPFLNLKDGPVHCQIVNTFNLSPLQTTDEFYVTINGDFLSQSALVYADKDVYIYNVNENEFRQTVAYNELLHKYKLSSPFSPNTKITDQFFLFSHINTSFTGKVLFQPNQNYFTFTPSSLLWYKRGFGFRVGMIVRLQLNSESSIDSDLYFHEFEIKEVTMLGEIVDSELHIVKLGSQEFFTNQQYQIVPVQELVHVQPAVVNIGSFSLVFHIAFKSQRPTVLNLLGNYFFPIVMSQQYKVRSKTTMSFQPNQTITPTNNDNVPIDLLSSQTINGVTGIKRATELDDGTFLIVTQQYNNIDKLRILSLAKRNNKIPFYCGGIENFIILSFTSEGVVPLNFTGSQITNSQMSCYEISINSLILPNRIIESTSALITSAYPYFFVEISNESLPSGGNTDIIYTNNPYASKGTLICSTTNVNDPNTTKFIKINSDGSSQIMKFSPFDNLRFRVSLPNGETFKTDLEDYLVPNDVNPRLQISVVIQILRL